MDELELNDADKMSLHSSVDSILHLVKCCRQFALEEKVGKFYCTHKKAARLIFFLDFALPCFLFALSCFRNCNLNRRMYGKLLFCVPRL